jgi:hypothetical protein
VYEFTIKNEEMTTDAARHELEMKNASEVPRFAGILGRV